MTMAGFDFEVRVKNTDETHPSNTPPQAISLFLAEKKAMAFWDDITDEIIIAADTIVIIENEILEKPTSREDAVLMLQKLSGKKHEVVTGVCILSKKGKVIFSEKTAVFFNVLTIEEIVFLCRQI
jgi:septum formation protein